MTNQQVKSIIVDATLADILDAYCEDVETIPTAKAKAFFLRSTVTGSGKLMRQCIFAGIFWAHSHPETINIEQLDDQD
jgi:hypothetical protein